MRRKVCRIPRSFPIITDRTCSSDASFYPFELSIRTIHTYISFNRYLLSIFVIFIALHLLCYISKNRRLQERYHFFRRVPLNLEMSIALRTFGSLRSMRKCWRLPLSRADMLCASFVWIPRIRRDRVFSCNRHERSSVLFALMFFKYQHSPKDAAARQKR